MAYLDMIETGMKIREIRKSRGKSVKDIANDLLVTTVAVYKWEQGIGMPLLDNLISLADILDCKIDDLLVVKKG